MKSFSSSAVKDILLPSSLYEDYPEEEGWPVSLQEDTVQKVQQPNSRKGEALPYPSAWDHLLLAPTRFSTLFPAN